MFTNTNRILFTALCLILTVSARAEMRFWHDRNGNEFRGEFSKEVFGNIYFRGVDGRVFPVAATNLIDSNMDYIRSLIPPKIQVDFSKKVREITEYPSDYDPSAWDDHEMEVTGLVSVKKMSRSPYRGTLRGEVYLIGKEVATADYRLFAKNEFIVSFPGESSEFRYQLTQRLRYYALQGDERRGAHYEGYVVIIEDSEGNPIAFKSNLSWMKEDKIEALRQIPCPGFLDDECKIRPVPRPKDIRSAGGAGY